MPPACTDFTDDDPKAFFIALSEYGSRTVADLQGLFVSPSIVARLTVEWLMNDPTDTRLPAAVTTPVEAASQELARYEVAAPSMVSILAPNSSSLPLSPDRTALTSACVG